MPKNWRWQLLVVSFALILNCAPVPPDVPACEHLGQQLTTDIVTGHLMLTPSPTCMKQISEPECAHCVYIVSGKEAFIGENKEHWLNGKPWSKVKQQSVMLPSVESYAPLATYIINSCKKNGCSSEVDRFKVKLGLLNLAK